MTADAKQHVFDIIGGTTNFNISTENILIIVATRNESVPLPSMLSVDDIEITEFGSYNTNNYENVLPLEPKSSISYFNYTRESIRPSTTPKTSSYFFSSKSSTQQMNFSFSTLLPPSLSENIDANAEIHEYTTNLTESKVKLWCECTYSPHSANINSNYILKSNMESTSTASAIYVSDSHRSSAINISTTIPAKIDQNGTTTSVENILQISSTPYKTIPTSKSIVSNNIFSVSTSFNDTSQFFKNHSGSHDMDDSNATVPINSTFMNPELNYFASGQAFMNFTDDTNIIQLTAGIFYLWNITISI